MLFSREELLFFTMITEGPMPFGIPLKFPREKNVEEVQKDIVEKLIQKELLDKENEFTESGIAVTLLWEEYRKCEKHLVINEKLLAVLPNRRVILIARQEKNFEIQSFDAVLVLAELLKECDFMRESTSDESYKPHILDIKEWHKKMQYYENRKILIGVFKNKKVEERAFYWEKNKGFMYDLDRQIEIQIQPRRMRAYFMKELGCR